MFQAIANHDPHSPVVIHSRSGRKFTYGQLLGDVAQAKDNLLKESGRSCLDGHRIAFLVENSYDYVGAHLQKPLLDDIRLQLIVSCSNFALHLGYPFNRFAVVTRISGP